ncbi:MAG TPA: ATP-binding protein [Chitinophagales bacterium]|nr:ATP-binding protein [Chitinophagales bacterium]HNM29311.1 ATP-binding protein [Chitinophagales bacterium]
MKIRRFHIILPIVFALCAITAYVIAGRAERSQSLEATAKHIEHDYQTLEREIIAVISDEMIISNLITDSYTFEEFSRLAERPYGIVVYQNDSALIWTNNFITPIKAQVPFNDAPLLISESNGEYIIFQHDFPGDVHVIGFLPLQFEYGIRNKYLDHVKSPGMHIPDFVRINPRAEGASTPVMSNSGNAVFYVSNDGLETAATVYPQSMFIMLILSALFWLMCMYQLARWIAFKFGRLPAVGALFILLSLSYILLRDLFYDNVLSALPLFDPQFYGSPGIAGSTGDLLIKTVWLFCFALFFSRFFFIKQLRSVWLKATLAIIVVLCTLVMGSIFRSLISDSSISFDISNFFSLNYLSFIGFLCISVLLLSYFLIIIRCIELVIRSMHRPLEFTVWVAVISILALLGEYFIGHALQTDMVCMITGFVLLRAVLMTKKINTRSLAGMMIWLVFFSAFGAYIFHTGITKKEEETKRLFALKKSIEKDPITEYLFAGAETEIRHQLEMQETAVEQGSRLRPGVIGQVRQNLQSNYFKKYDTDIFLFENDSLLITTDQQNPASRIGFIDAIENNGEFTAAENLYFINDYTGNYYYLAELTTPIDSNKSLTTYLRMVPRKFSGASIYPELLIDDDLRTAESFIDFDYAIYNDHSLTEREGNYSYPLMDIFYINKDEESADIMENDYDHYIYKVNDNKKVIVSTPAISWFQPVSLFSYLFFFFLVFLVIVLVLDWGAGLLQGKIRLKEWIDTTLQNKIQSAVLSLIIFAFIMMGVATVFYISNQYNDSHKQRLLEKIEGVQTNIDFLLGENKRKTAGAPVNTQLKKIGNRVTELSEIHAMDINIYKPSGALLASSQPDIFDKGLVSRNMNPLAFFKMSCDKETWYIQTERIGDLSFLSAYVPVLDSEGETMFFLNLPYFATEQNLKAEISSFMVTLVNVYVLLLIVAGIIAFFVSRSITKPLAAIAGKFREIKLGKSNEPIFWTHDDEIGILVSEYNKMLKELDNSAQLLARSERESAWRDMAKQVAHEIKNPLTPMRLSIQHLQRAIQTNAPNVQELTRKVTVTILEQIDNLTHIASEFSNFAVMPKPVNEQICLNDVLDSVTALFNETENAAITLEMPDERIMIFADKNQVIRVFNNVIKNAIQAIPDDREGIIAVSLESNEHRALVKVKDNGRGIGDEEKDKVFVPNFTTKSSGMGIGLAMTKNIVEGAGGYIWFESTVSVGTTFYIEFPLMTV